MRPVFDVAYASNLIFSRTSDALLHKMRAAGSPLLELSDPLTHASSFSSTKGSCVSEGGGVLFLKTFSHQIGPLLLWQLCRGSAGWNQVECPLFQEKSRLVKYDNSIWSAYCNFFSHRVCCSVCSLLARSRKPNPRRTANHSLRSSRVCSTCRCNGAEADTSLGKKKKNTMVV